MSEKSISILLGGFIPAILFGVSGVFQKVTAKTGIGTGPYMLIAGLMVAVTGAAITLYEKDFNFDLRGGLYSCLFGLSWSLSTAFVAIALRRYNGQISQLVPIYNTNTLVAVLLGVVFLSEWQNLNVAKLLIAAILIVVGGVLAASA